MIRLGVTGGIGSGKSTVAALLARLGAGRVLDADQIARAVTQPQGSAIPALRSAFGADILAPDGSMNRDTARQRAFDDPAFRSRLEAIIHPLVQQEFAKADQHARAQQLPLLVYDIPLLVESGYWRSRLNHVLVTDCTNATQIARVVQRNGLSEVQVQAILRAQTSRSTRLAAADLVLFNDGIDLPQLEKLCQQVCTILGLHIIAKDSA